MANPYEGAVAGNPGDDTSVNTNTDNSNNPYEGATAGSTDDVDVDWWGDFIGSTVGGTAGALAGGAAGAKIGAATGATIGSVVPGAGTVIGGVGGGVIGGLIGSVIGGATGAYGGSVVGQMAEDAIEGGEQEVNHDQALISGLLGGIPGGPVVGLTKAGAGKLLGVWITKQSAKDKAIIETIGPDTLIQLVQRNAGGESIESIAKSTGLSKTALESLFKTHGSEITSAIAGKTLAGSGADSALQSADKAAYKVFSQSVDNLDPNSLNSVISSVQQISKQGDEIANALLRNADNILKKAAVEVAEATTAEAKKRAVKRQSIAIIIKSALEGGAQGVVQYNLGGNYQNVKLTESGLEGLAKANGISLHFKNGKKKPVEQLLYELRLELGQALFNKGGMVKSITDPRWGNPQAQLGNKFLHHKHNILQAPIGEPQAIPRVMRDGSIENQWWTNVGEGRIERENINPYERLRQMTMQQRSVNTSPLDSAIAEAMKLKQLGVSEVKTEDRYGNKLEVSFAQPDVKVNVSSSESQTGGANPGVDFKNAGGIIVQPQIADTIQEAHYGDVDNFPGDPKGVDTVPVWTQPGEFIVNKEATEMYGPVIEQINNHGREIQAMKAGGQVNYLEAGGVTQTADMARQARIRLWLEEMAQQGLLNPRTEDILLSRLGLTRGSDGVYRQTGGIIINNRQDLEVLAAELLKEIEEQENLTIPLPNALDRLHYEDGGEVPSVPKLEEEVGLEPTSSTSAAHILMKDPRWSAIKDLSPGAKGLFTGLEELVELPGAIWEVATGKEGYDVDLTPQAVEDYTEESRLLAIDILTDHYGDKVKAEEEANRLFANSEFVGSLLTPGGVLKGGKLVSKLDVDPNTLGTIGGNIGKSTRTSPKPSQIAKGQEEVANASKGIKRDPTYLNVNDIDNWGNAEKRKLGAKFKALIDRGYTPEAAVNEIRHSFTSIPNLVKDFERTEEITTAAGHIKKVSPESTEWNKKFHNKIIELFKEDHPLNKATRSLQENGGGHYIKGGLI